MKLCDAHCIKSQVSIVKILGANKNSNRCNFSCVVFSYFVDLIGQEKYVRFCFGALLEQKQSNKWIKINCQVAFPISSSQFSNFHTIVLRKFHISLGNIKTHEKKNHSTSERVSPHCDNTSVTKLAEVLQSNLMLAVRLRDESSLKTVAQGSSNLCGQWWLGRQVQGSFTNYIDKTRLVGGTGDVNDTQITP